VGLLSVPFRRGGSVFKVLYGNILDKIAVEKVFVVVVNYFRAGCS